MPAADLSARFAPRCGRAPLPLAEIIEIAKDQEASHKDIVIALNWTFDEVLGVRKQLREFLRKFSGSKASEDSSAVAGNQRGDIYKKGDRLRIWMEERPKGLSVDCLAHGIYTQAEDCHKDFRARWKKTDDGRLIEDRERNIATRGEDAHDEMRTMIDRPNLFMRRLMLQRLIHLEMWEMKRNPLVRILDTESRVKVRVPALPAEKRKRDIEEPTPGRKRARKSKQCDKKDIAIYLNRADSEDPETTKKSTVTLQYMLPEDFSNYKAALGVARFPYDDLSTKALWVDVGNMLGQSWKAAKRDGFLVYEASCDGVADGEKVSYNVEEGPQLGWVVQFHYEWVHASKTDEDVPIHLVYYKGQYQGACDFFDLAV